MTVSRGDGRPLVPVVVPVDLGVEQAVGVDDEIAHQGVVDGGPRPAYWRGHVSGVSQRPKIGRQTA